MLVVRLKLRLICRIYHIFQISPGSAPCAHPCRARCKRLRVHAELFKASLFLIFFAALVDMGALDLQAASRAPKNNHRRAEVRSSQIWELWPFHHTSLRINQGLSVRRILQPAKLCGCKIETRASKYTNCSYFLIWKKNVEVSFTGCRQIWSFSRFRIAHRGLN